MARKEKERRLSKIGLEMKIAMAKMDITQKELAEEVGIASSYINDIIYGRRSGKKHWKKIKEALKLKLPA